MQNNSSKSTALNHKIINSANTRGTIVFLHEALGSIGQWKGFPERVCQKFDVRGVVYERCGHGDSPPFNAKRTPRYMHEYAYEELTEFLDSLGIYEPVTLFGHSDGGSIALLFASKFPDRVKTVITEAAHVIVEPETVQGIIPVKRRFESDPNFQKKLAEYHGDKTSDLFYAWCDTWLSDEFRSWDITQDIQNIQAPVLAFQGSRDQFGTRKQLELIKAAASSPVQFHELDGLKHIPHLEDEEAVMELVRIVFGQKTTTN